MNMKVIEGRGRGVRVLKTETSAIPSPRGRGVGPAVLLSAIVAALMVGASVLGIVVHDLYREGAWAREAFRGGDVVTLVLVVPVLITSMALARRGSVRATVVWIGALAYAVYNYAYYVFGASFNDAFLIHIAIFSSSILALVLAISRLDVVATAEPLRHSRLARWIGGFLTLVGVGQCGLWVFVIVRYAVTGEVLADKPVRGQHVVFALDLSLLVPALVVSGVLLWRRTPIGYVAAGIVSVMGSLVLLNLLLAGAFQANADVAGVRTFPPEGIAMAVGMIASMVLLLGARTQTRGGTER
jgi:hypothetical protein